MPGKVPVGRAGVYCVSLPCARARARACVCVCVCVCVCACSCVYRELTVTCVQSPAHRYSLKTK